MKSLVKGLALTRSGWLALSNSRWYQHVIGRGYSLPFWVWLVGSKVLAPLAGNRYRGGWIEVGSSLRSQSRVMEELMSSLRHCPLAAGTITGIS